MSERWTDEETELMLRMLLDTDTEADYWKACETLTLSFEKGGRISKLGRVDPRLVDRMLWGLVTRYKEYHNYPATEEFKPRKITEIITGVRVLKPMWTWCEVEKVIKVAVKMYEAGGLKSAKGVPAPDYISALLRVPEAAVTEAYKTFGMAKGRNPLIN